MARYDGAGQARTVIQGTSHPGHRSRHDQIRVGSARCPCPAWQRHAAAVRDVGRHPIARRGQASPKDDRQVPPPRPTPRRQRRPQPFKTVALQLFGTFDRRARRRPAWRGSERDVIRQDVGPLTHAAPGQVRALLALLHLRRSARRGTPRAPRVNRMESSRREGYASPYAETR